MEHFRAQMIPDPPLVPGGETSWRSLVVDTLQTIILSVVLFLAINAVSARIRVESVSMMDTLHPRDFVLVNKLAYRFSEPKRGDVVVFDPPVASSEPYIKRIIGLPGDVIEIKNNKLYVNGELMIEPYLQSDMRARGDWTVPEDSIFVMGDNRNNSSDSRAWGAVPLENVIGEAIFVYWPPEQWDAFSSKAIAAEHPYP